MSTYINILDRRVTRNTRFNMDSVELVIKFKDQKDFPNENILQFYLNCFQDVLNYFKETEKVLPNDFIGIKIGIQSLENTKPVGVSFRPFQALSPQIITDVLMNVMQSNAVFSSSTLLDVGVTIVRNPTGSGRNKRKLYSKYMSEDEILKHKTNSLIIVPEIFETDDLKCLPRSIVVGKHFADCGYVRKKIKSLFRPGSLVLNREANAYYGHIYNKMDGFNEHGSTICDLYKYTKLLKDYQIVVYDDKDNPASVLFKSAKKDKRINIFYFKEKKHFTTISSLTGFFGLPKQCKLCDMLYNTTHKCKQLCHYCKKTGPCPTVKQMLDCESCNRSFRGSECFQAHKQAKDDKTPSVCDQFRICKQCFKYVDYTKLNGKKHVCSDRVCDVCNKLVDQDHLCYVQPYTRKRPEKFTILFFDIECTQERDLLNKNNESIGQIHEPNLLVSNKVCDLCYERNIGEDNSENEFCIKCKTKQRVFRGRNCVSQFIDYLSEHNENSHLTHCISHNGRAYDHVYIMRDLLKRKKPVSPLLSGLKVLKIVYNNTLIFLDSLNFIPMSLSKMPKAFGIPDTQKGIYPHYFNRMSNSDYIGPLPGKEFYSTDWMSDAEKNKFNEWHDNLVKSNYVFNNRVELEKYCIEDVIILRRAALVYMRDFLTLFDFNPFLQSMTLAQCMLLVYRKQFLEPNTLPVIPKNQYKSTQNRSRICRKWIIYQNSKLKGKGFIKEEVKLPSNISVDGYDELNNTIYEFNVSFFSFCLFLLLII